MTTTSLDTPAQELDGLLSRIGKSIASEVASSADTARLREQAMQMATKINAHAEESRKKMLEPLLPRAQIDDAKRNAEGAAIDSQRLETAIELLLAREDDLLKREHSLKKFQRYQIAKEQRDRVSASITDRFPAIAAEYLKMIESIMESNDAVDRVNLDLPEGEQPLERPEGHARGFHDNGGYQTDASYRAFRITQSILPSPHSPDCITWPTVPDYQTAVVRRSKGFTQSDVRTFWARRKP